MARVGAVCNLSCSVLQSLTDQPPTRAGVTE